MGNSRPIAMMATAVLILAAVLVSGCGEDDGGDGGDSGGETLTVGSDIPFPPFEFGKPPNYTGYDIELVEAMAERTGRRAEFQDTSFETIFRDLAQGKFDMVASASTITDEREKTVDFTDPYYLSEQAIMVLSGTEFGPLESLKGATVGVQQGTTGQEFAESDSGAAEVRPFPQGPDAISALKAGVIDAVVIDIPVAEDAVKGQSDLEISEAIPTEEEYGFPVAEGDDELLEELNEALKELKDDGTFARIYEKWFKRPPTEELLSATHEPS
jgi:ABC-type amino acid transport substrate-binding protein